MENDKNAPANNTSEQETINKLKADHDSLYGKYTQKSEKLNKLAEIAFKSNPNVLPELPDEVKDKIVKENFWVDSYEEAVAVLWVDFYTKGENKNKKETETFEDFLSEYQQEKKLSEYKLKQKEEELAIDLYIAKNEKLFDWIENPKDLIKKEVKKLSDGLSIEEKLEDASALVNIKYWSKVNFANNKSWPSVNKSDKETPQRNKSLASIFWNKL